MPENKNKIMEYTLLGIVFLLVIIGIVLAKTNPTFFKETYAVEDGPIEWLTVVGLVLGSMVCFKRAIQYANKRSYFFVCTILLGCLFLFGAGEEISWGQRIIGFETPELMKEYNAQKETNLHNLKFEIPYFGKVKINKLVFGLILSIVIVCYLVFAPILYTKTSVGKQFIETFAIPVPRPIHIAAYAILFLLLLSLSTKNKGELLEFGGVWIFLSLVCWPANVEMF